MKNKKPLLIGLTGSFAMGKSTAARMFADLGVMVFCADKAVHKILSCEERKNQKLYKKFPSAFIHGKIDRKILGALVFKNDLKMKELENILHPLVEKERKLFLKEARKQKAKTVLFDIPLLFETGADKKCDVTICVSASLKIQKERAQARKNMTPSLFRAILKRQMPDKEKRQLASFVLRSDKGKGDMRRQIKALYQQLEKEFLNA